MALFGRESDDKTTARPNTAPTRKMIARSTPKTTLIAVGATVIGEITGDTDVMIEGTVEGKVHPTQNVTVGEHGVVRGKIHARRVRVAGRVEGNVHASESIEILTTGSLEGDVMSPGMVIGDGAFFKGRVEMTGQKASAREAAEKLPAKPAVAPVDSASSSRPASSR